MALREMMKMKEIMDNPDKGLPESVKFLAALQAGGRPPPEQGMMSPPSQPQGMMPPAAPPQGMMPPAPSPAMPPQSMPQSAPAMGGPAMPFSGLAGIASSPVMPEAPESNMIINALKTLDKRGNKETTYKKLARAAEDRGMTLPSANSGLMRLAAEGGPVLYRREGGVSSGSSREETLAKLQAVVDRYGAFVPKIGEPLDYFSNNPLVGFSGGGGEGGTPYNELYIRDTEGPGGILSLSGRGTNRNFEKEYQALAAQLKEPEPEVESTDFVPLSDTRYGSLNDPNLPAMDAAQQRLQYRQNVGFYDKPPGPTANTNRILAQAYGEGTPIYEEILQGLQPTPTQPVSTETAMEAYYGLPGSNYQIPDPEEPDIEPPILLPLPMPGDPPVSRPFFRPGEDPNELVYGGPAVPAKTGGGLYELAAGGEFSGRVPGDGGGMQDNVRMPIMEGEEQVATLAVSPTEYVVDSHTMAALGNGNPDKGADYMDGVVKNIRKEAYGTDKQPNEINGLQTLMSMMG